MNISAQDAIAAASPEWGGRLKFEPNGPYPAKGIKCKQITIITLELLS